MKIKKNILKASIKNNSKNNEKNSAEITASTNETNVAFSAALNDEGGAIKPLKTSLKKHCVQKKDKAVKPNLAQQARQKNATLEEKAPNPFQTSDVPSIGPHDSVGDKKPGVQDGVFRKLRLGQYTLDARIDLHRKTIEQAADDVFAFIQDALAHDIRSLLITHGKAARQEQPAILKSYVCYWLANSDAVLAYHSAQPRHGGSGATYVLLRKSEKKKQQNRESFEQK